MVQSETIAKSYMKVEKTKTKTNNTSNEKIIWISEAELKGNEKKNCVEKKLLFRLILSFYCFVDAKLD